MDRWIELEGCVNARDLGGLPTTDGAATKRGRLIRSDAVQELTPSDLEILVNDMGLRSILDLRAPIEVANEGRGLLADTEVQYYNTSFIPDSYLTMDDEARRKVIVDSYSASGPGPAAHYFDYVARPDTRVPAAVQLIAQGDSQPVLFHCAAGKDRTGILAALVLDIVGVEREAIVDDYVATNDRLPQIHARLAAKQTYSEATNRDIGCRAETMWTFFQLLDDKWGDASGWARNNGLDQADLDKLRETLVA